jgi:hypothetical protein
MRDNISPMYSLDAQFRSQLWIAPRLIVGMNGTGSSAIT